MIKRITTGLLIIGCVIPPLLVGGYFLDALIAIVIMVGGFELVSLLPNRKAISTPFILIVYLGVILATMLSLSKGMAVFALLVLLLLAYQVVSPKYTSDDAFFLIAIITILFSFASSFKIIYTFDPLYIWFVLLATYGCDTGAYFVGSMFGKTKLIPNISPNKTLEGAIGGWVIGALMSCFFAIFFIQEMDLLVLILGSLWLPVISQIGDLSFSAIKRHFNIKDFSNIFPGHGGFMDRIDSLIFNLIAFASIMVLVL